MTEASTPFPPEVDASQTPAASAPARTAHDRELPVTATEGDRTPPAPRAAAAAGAPATHAANPSDETEEPLGEDQVKLALRRVKDPDLNLNILDLGLVYDIRVDGSAVAVDMTLTSPGCPSGAEIMADAERHLRALPGVSNVAVNLVWTPFWTPDRIEPRVRAYLGF
jgi:metal-sulfur cluster biosynthetic enzyme